MLRGSDPLGKYPHKVNVRKQKGDLSSSGETQYPIIHVAAIKNFLGITCKASPLLYIWVDPKGRTYILGDHSRREIIRGIKSLKDILKLIKDRLLEMLEPWM